MKKFSFSKSERLRSRKAMEEIFETGTAVNNFPLRIMWKETMEAAVPLQIAITVPKKNFKRAVDRNRIKRLIREAYRLNKGKILPAIVSSGKNFSAIIIFTGKERATYSDTEGKLVVILQRFAEKACIKHS